MRPSSFKRHARQAKVAPPRLSGPLPPRLWLIALGILVAAAVTAGAILSIRQSYRESLARSESNLRNLTFVLSEQTDRAIQSLEVIQDDIIGRLLQNGVRTMDDLRKVGAQQATYLLLARKALTLPQADGIAVIDANGQSVVTSREWPPVGNQDLSDRTYFQTLRADPALMTFISRPIFTKDVGKKTVVFARKILNQDDEFIGIILVSIELRYFEDIYRSLVTTETGTLNLYRHDGTLLIRHPASGIAADLNVHEEGTAVKAMAEGKQSLVRGKSPYDGKDRLAAGRALTRYPLTVVATEAVDTVLSDWRQDAVVIGVVALLMNLAMGTALFLGYRVTKVSLGRAERESYLARHDVTTQLPNRLLFNEEIERATMRVRAERGSFALFLLDLNRFKDVNDTHGHPTGDGLLRAVTQRLRSHVRETDLVARIGGDEFAVLQHDLAGRENAEATATRLLEALSKPYMIQGYEMSIGVSIGIAQAPEHGATSDDLLKAADLALYATKGEQTPNFRIFDAEMNKARLERLTLENDLRTALARQELELHYQPILDLSTDAISGFEALARWRHQERGLVPPSIFIPMAEEIGLIDTLGDWVLETACCEAVTWPEGIKVAVNLSPMQFKGRDVLSCVRNAIASSGLSPHRLELEITETVLLDGDAQAIIPQIKSLGVSIALDDFGTGYASLSYLCRFPFDKIKIDQSFVQGMGTSASSRAVVYAALYLAQELGIGTTAEGVETEEQMKALRKAGATEVQGYLISRPMPASQIPSLLSHDNACPQER
jgi:diguanylate cyclase (GGDEF)-like protein